MFEVRFVRGGKKPLVVVFRVNIEDVTLSILDAVYCNIILPSS